MLLVKRNTNSGVKRRLNLMNKSTRNGLLFIGASVFCLLIGLSVNGSTVREENIKYLFISAGLSVFGLYWGLSWKNPSYGGGVVHKYTAIIIGIFSGICFIYLLIQMLRS